MPLAMKRLRDEEYLKTLSYRKRIVFDYEKVTTEARDFARAFIATARRLGIPLEVVECGRDCEIAWRIPTPKRLIRIRHATMGELLSPSEWKMLDVIAHESANRAKTKFVRGNEFEHFDPSLYLVG